LKKYRFELIHTDIPNFQEKDHVIVANSLDDAIHKFVRKHEVEAPVYWDEPSYDKHIELYFKSSHGTLHYQINWEV
jgi:hypothetical protein